MVFALTVDDGERESDLDGVMRPQNCRVGKGALFAPCPPIHSSMFWWARFRFAHPTKSGPASNLAGDVLLHPVGHLDQPPPRLLQERHHPIHVAVARQRYFDLALAVGHL